MISRRDFLKNLSWSGLGLAVTPLILGTRPFLAFAEDQYPSKTVFVLIFQRGAMDGLSMVPPIGDSHYLEHRPNIGLKAGSDNGPISLDGYFSLHPSLKDLKPLWDEGTLGFVHQVGSPSHSRSHFDAQDFMELGTPDDKNTTDGFLNRALLSNRLPKESSVRGVALQANMPRILQGNYPAISMNSIKDYRLSPGVNESKAQAGFEQMYEKAADRVLRGVGAETFASLSAVKDLEKNDKKSASDYPKSQIANHLREIATIIKADIGLQVAVTDMGGWDTHVNQGNQNGQLSDRFRELAEAVSAFRRDLGNQYERVCLLTVTEFGRTVKENGDRGTDHGHGSVMMMMGGRVKGKKVYGKYQDLAKGNLFEERDMPVNTDFRDVFAEVMKEHLKLQNIEKIFPGYAFAPQKKLGFVKSS